MCLNKIENVEVVHYNEEVSKINKYLDTKDTYNLALIVLFILQNIWSLYIDY